jgi:hypothetical protein
MAITAWSAKVLTSSICRSVNGRTSARRTKITPMASPALNQRDAEGGTPTDLERNLPALGVFIRFGQDICDLNRSPVDDGTPVNAPTHKWYGVLSDRATQGNLPMVGDEAQTIAKHLKDRRALHRRVADSTSESRTLCRSRADRLTTFKTSAMTVCCSRASVSSRVLDCTSSKSRVFSIAITLDWQRC